jgi:surface antigen
LLNKTWKLKSNERLNYISRYTYNRTISSIRTQLKRLNFKDFQTKIFIYQRNIADFIKKRRTVKLLHLTRRYSALVVVISSAILVVATNLAAGKESSGFLFGYWGNENKDIQSPKANKVSAQIDKKNNLAMAPLIKPNASTDANFKEEENQNFIQEQSLMVANVSPLKDPEEEGGVKIYTVKEGDTVSQIATNNHITVNTILWANDIDNVDSIMPGDKIFILPVAGLSYTVKKGDNIESIAKKYSADKDKIIAFNNLSADGTLEEGGDIIIPDGQKEQPVQSTTPGSEITRRQYATPLGGAPTISGWKSLGGKAGTGHSFPYGYCTWYVAQKRYVPWGGNAGTWLYHAKSQGYRTGKSPSVGAIIVTSESWWGHVGIVEKVSGGTVTIAEMNYKGWGKVDRRQIDTSSRVVKGYIY